jgi:hypothetical protein
MALLAGPRRTPSPGVDDHGEGEGRHGPDVLAARLGVGLVVIDDPAPLR